jgi:hypothetical protein
VSAVTNTLAYDIYVLQYKKISIGHLFGFQGQSFDASQIDCSHVVTLKDIFQFCPNSSDLDKFTKQWPVL